VAEIHEAKFLANPRGQNYRESKGGSWRKEKVLWTWKELVKSTSSEERGTTQDAETGKTRNYFGH